MEKTGPVRETCERAGEEDFAYGFSRESTSSGSTMSTFPAALVIKSVDSAVIKKSFTVALREAYRSVALGGTKKGDSLVVEMNIPDEMSVPRVRNLCTN